MPTVTTVAYEVVIRYRLGVLSGSHVGWSLLVTEDDGTKRETPIAVDPVDIGQGKGFPLSDLLEKIHVDALIAVAAKDVEIADTITAKYQELTDAANEKVAALAAVEAEKAALAEAKDAEIATKTADHAAALEALGAETAAREAKERESAKLAERLATKDAEIELLKMPEKDRLQAALRAKAAELLKQADEIK